jgi:LCP family protein required for cell wall assembly
MRKNRMNRKKKTLLISALAVSLTIGGILAYLYSQFNHIEINKSDEALGIKPKSSEMVVKAETKDEPIDKFNNQIINIALFGVDRRSGDEQGRADSTMILTFDFKHNKLKLSSLMRDMYVEIEGYENTKFNHAYAYGGAPLAIKTINQNFDTDIRDYVTVDFFTLEKIIDEIGGIELDIKEEEYPLINRHMQEVANIQSEEAIQIEHAGLQTLNGKQAVAYSRIRYVGNGDFERTERQRKVLSQMVKQVEGLSKAELPALVMKVLPYVETSLDTNTIIDLGLKYMTEGIDDMEQDRFPRDGYWDTLRIKGGWYMKVDFESTKDHIDEFIYEHNVQGDKMFMDTIQDEFSSEQNHDVLFSHQYRKERP